MFNRIAQNLSISAANRLLKTDQTDTVSTVKRLLSVVAGGYILQRGIRTITKHPITSIQESLLGIFIIYDAIKGIKETYPKKPTDVSQVRKNQIQGNDPSSATPAFV